MATANLPCQASTCQPHPPPKPPCQRNGRRPIPQLSASTSDSSTALGQEALLVQGLEDSLLALFSTCLDTVALEEVCASEAGSVDMDMEDSYLPRRLEMDMEAESAVLCGEECVMLGDEARECWETDGILCRCNVDSLDNDTDTASVASLECELGFQEHVAKAVARHHVDLWSEGLEVSSTLQDCWQKSPSLGTSVVSTEVLQPASMFAGYGLTAEDNAECFFQEAAKVLASEDFETEFHDHIAKVVAGHGIDLWSISHDVASTCASAAQDDECVVDAIAEVFARETAGLRSNCSKACLASQDQSRSAPEVIGSDGKHSLPCSLGSKRDSHDEVDGLVAGVQFDVLNSAFQACLAENVFLLGADPKIKEDEDEDATETVGNPDERSAPLQLNGSDALDLRAAPDELATVMQLATMPEPSAFEADLGARTSPGALDDRSWRNLDGKLSGLLRKRRSAASVTGSVPTTPSSLQIVSPEHSIPCVPSCIWSNGGLAIAQKAAAGQEVGIMTAAKAYKAMREELAHPGFQRWQAGSPVNACRARTPSHDGRLAVVAPGGIAGSGAGIRVPMPKQPSSGPRVDRSVQTALWMDSTKFEAPCVPSRPTADRHRFSATTKSEARSSRPASATQRRPLSASLRRPGSASSRLLGRPGSARASRLETAQSPVLCC